MPNRDIASQEEVAQTFEPSPQQTRLWALREEGGDASAYRGFCLVGIDGHLDTKLLKAAIEAVVNRHEILRTAFHSSPDTAMPLQIIAAEGLVPIEERNVCELPSLEREAAIQACLREIRQRSFDLTRPQALHLSLVNVSPERHLLLISSHGLYADATGLKNLVREIARAYDAPSRPGEMPDEPLQYADLSQVFVDLLDSEETAPGRAYWDQQDLSALDNLKLPGELKTGPGALFNPQLVSVRLDDSLVRQIETQAGEFSTTLQVYLQTCWHALLGRMTGMSRIIVGTAFDGRTFEGLGEAIGLFARYLPLGTAFDSGASFAELLKQVRARTEEILPWQECFRWKENAGAHGTHASAPFFPFCFDYDDVRETWRAGEAGGGSATLFSVAERYAYVDRFKIQLRCVRGNDGLEVQFHYDETLYLSEDIARLSERYLTLLQNSLKEPEIKLQRLGIISSEEQVQLRVEWSNYSDQLQTASCLHELFEEQVERTPHQIALVFEDLELSYAELNSKANQLAHHLIGLGVAPEQVVGLCLERSPEMVIAILAVLKAGAAYLPLDPALPEERFSFLFNDVQPPVLLTQLQLLTQLPSEVAAADIVCLDLDENLISAHSLSNPSRQVSPDNLAYVIYTSGSTGVPKGVCITHRAIANHTLAVIDVFSLTSSDRVLQFATFNFDVSVEQLMSSLLCGATVVMRGTALWSVSELWRKVAAERLSVVNLPTAFWHQVVGESIDAEALAGSGDNGSGDGIGGNVGGSNGGDKGGGGLKNLRLMIAGGEKMQGAAVVQWRAKGLAGVRLLNAYGPTETTITATVHEVADSEQIEEGRGVKIGRVVGARNCYVLDERGEMVGSGVAGELYIGGEWLARGYRGRAEWTGERFVPDEWSGQAGARMYRTGDIVRRSVGGELEYVGRVDRQVKVRGNRVELEEVESVLMGLSGVLGAAVEMRKGAGGEERLVAYIEVRKEEAGREGIVREAGDGDGDGDGKGEEKVGGKGEEKEVGGRGGRRQWREEMRERVPEYMVPQVYVEMERLPLTASGKIDREALPDPDLTRAQAEASYVAPRTAIEKRLADIWSRVLGIEEVGINDNFFELGGDSILSIQVVARAHQAGLRLSPKQLFQHQTIAALAEVAGIEGAFQAEQEEVAGIVPLTPVQSWFFERDLANPHHFNQSVLLEARREIELSKLETVWAHLVAHHDALRLRFNQDRGFWEQFNRKVDMEKIVSRVDLSEVEEAERSAHIESHAEAAQRSLNISHGPLARIVLFDLGAEHPSRLLIVIHHLAVDGVSWRILLEDLQSGYEQLERGEAVRFPLKTTSFKSWSERLFEFAQSEELQQEADYWLEQGREDCRSLPVDQTGGRNLAASARTIEAHLSREETRTLLQDAPKKFHTGMNEVLLTALVRSFSRWSGAPSMLIDMEGHGREQLFDDVDISRTVGWFTSIFPLRLETGGGVSPVETLKRVKEHLGRLPNKGIGYGLLRYLTRERAEAGLLEHLTQAEVNFNYLGQFDQVLAESSPFRVASESSGATRSPEEPRRYLIEINSSIAGGLLQLEWTYSEDLHRRDTIENLARAFMEELRGLIALTAQPERVVVAPSDFGLSEITPAQLERLFAAEPDIEDIYPLSPMQQGILFHSLYVAPSHPLEYVAQVGCRINGDLRVEAFKRAWQQAVKRHSIFRTTFHWEHLDEPLQIVHREGALEWSEEDWRGLPPDEQEMRLESFSKAVRRNGVNLSKGPLMHLALIRTSDTAYDFIWNSHHLLLDGWAQSQVIREIFALYDSFVQADSLEQADSLVQAEDANLPPARPYREYVDWLRRQDLAGAEQFWREMLRGFTAPTLLGTAMQTKESVAEGEVNSVEELVLPEAATAELHRLSRQYQLTLNTLVQGVWSLLLTHYTGMDDIVFGVVSAGRPPALDGVETMVGLFINTLPVRVRKIPGATFAGWLAMLQEQQAAGRQFEYSPLVQVQQWSELPQGAALFDTIFVFENYPVDASLLQPRTDAEITNVRAYVKNNFPLTLRVLPGASLTVQMMFDLRRFDASEVALLLKLFKHLVELIMANPEATLETLADALAAADREHRAQAEKEEKDSRRQKLKQVKRKGISGISSKV